ncbi:aspartic peptidase domain-containing protein [Xylariaceae sp. FL0016]|nr:aspartic peptidase domain-containing protein [Xylariaceae sp. FL0016]
MKTSALYAASAALLSVLPSEVLCQVRVPFARQKSANRNVVTSRRATDGTPPPNITFFGGEATYIVNATVGTPPQDLSFALSLSADESWVPDVDYCEPDETSISYGGCIYGAYDSYASSTYEADDYDSFDTYYVDDTYASGSSMRDTIGFPGGGASLPNITMGLASETNIWMAVMALGFDRSSYDDVSTIPDAMVNQSLINSPAYSMWLEDEDAESGNILFGAVDKAAMDGTLRRTSLEREQYDDGSGGYSTIYTFDVYVQAFNRSDSSAADAETSPLIQNNTALPLVTIDPTYTVSVLPNDLAQAIWKMAGVTHDVYSDYATIPCAWKSNLTGSLSIQLGSVGPDGGPILNVPLSDLVVSEDIWSYDDYEYPDDYFSSYDDAESTYNITTYCLFGVQNSTYSSYYYSSSTSYEGSYNFGAGMLKRAYMVFDLANEEIAMAPVKFGVSDEDIVSFESYGAVIPESTGDTGKCYGCSDGSSSSSSGSNGSGGLSREVIGIIAGMSVVAAAMIGIAIWGIVACARTKRPGQEMPVMSEKGKGVVDPARTAQENVPAPNSASEPTASPPAATTTTSTERQL